MTNPTLVKPIASQLGCIFTASLLLQYSPLASAQAGTNDSSRGNVLEEITVTAQKRAQSLQEVPAAVTAVGSEAITVRGITNIADLQNLVPSIRLQRESASTEIYIRGVGSTLDLPMIEPPNAYNINGVYIPREVSSATLVDVERLEVLPGPQGTLYGRGAIGGVVNTITKRPSDNFETQALVEAGNYSHVRSSITQNIPVTENFSLRGSLSYLDRDGYLETGADSAEDFAGFFSLGYTPSDNLDIFVWTHIEEKEGFSANLLSKGTVGDPKSQAFPNSDPWNDTLEGDLEPFATLGPIDAQSREWEVFIVGAEVDWDINDQLSLSYLPAYLDFDWHQQYWLTHKPGDFNEKIEQQTHELRLAFDNGGAWNWLAGFYSYNIETSGQLFIQFGPDELFPGSPPGLWLDVSDIRHHELKGVAGFGEISFAISDRTRLIAGGRISADERVANGFQPDIVVEPAVDTDPVALFTGAPPPTWDNQDEWDNVDWKAGIEFDAGEESLLYGTIQTGFQPGTFDVFPDSVTEPSELLSYTIGTKNFFADGQVMLNDEIFYYIYDNLLTQAFNAATGGNFLTNADVIIYGNQLDLAFAPEGLPNTQFRLSVGYLHARYDDFIVDSLDVFIGSQLQNAPDWTTTLGIVHDWNFESGAYLRADLSSRYESGYWGDFSHSSGLYQEAYTKTDLAITYHSNNGNWSLGLWGRNLENQDVQAAAATANPITDPGPGAPFLEAPRTYGIRFTMDFSAD